MSNTASRLSAFKSHFDSVTQSFSSALKLLQDQSAQQAQAQKEQFALMTQLLQCIMPAPAMQSPASQPAPSADNNDPADSEIAEPNGHHIIVLLDANDDMRNSNSSMTLSQLTLRETIMDRHGCTAPSTYKQNMSQTPIDGIWISPGLNIISGGYLPFDQIFQDTDHRCLWMDVSFISAFGYKMPPIVKPKPED
jgi:hypothetical protein